MKKELKRERTQKVTIKLEIVTNKPNNSIMTSLQKGIYRCLDIESNYIAQPANVRMQITFD